jgi:acyl-coenzyme A synthetase/AMP-(fatty) acid ligase
MKIGTVPIPTNTMLKANDFLYFLNDSGAKTLIVHDMLYCSDLYAKMLQSMEKSAGKPDMDSLRLCVSAGEALPAELNNRWKNLTNLEILDGIGSTEALHIFISNRQGEVKPGSSGRIVPGYEA